MDYQYYVHYVYSMGFCLIYTLPKPFNIYVASPELSIGYLKGNFVDLVNKRLLKKRSGKSFYIMYICLHDSKLCIPLLFFFLGAK